MKCTFELTSKGFLRQMANFDLEFKAAFHFGDSLAEYMRSILGMEKPDGLKQEAFFDGISIPGNRELMRVYRDLKLVEQLGSGVPPILESYGRECFHFTGDFIRMTFPAEGEATTGLVNGLVESQQRILQLIKQNPKISERQMAQNIGISTTAIDKNLNSLREKGIIQQVGSDRGGYWEKVNI